MDAISFNDLPNAVLKIFDKLSAIEQLLLTKPATPIPDADELLTVQQAAEFLKLSVPTIYGLVSKAEIPVNKRGKRLYFSKGELTAWVKAGRKKTLAEVQEATQKHITRKGR
jgi:excisionase family DNA binding protein